jgi:hypothetical protein
MTLLMMKDVGYQIYIYEDINKIANKYGFDIVDYKTFYNELPSDYKESSYTQAKEKWSALLNPINKKPRLVINIGTINTKHLNIYQQRDVVIYYVTFIHSKRFKRTHRIHYQIQMTNSHTIQIRDEVILKLFNCTRIIHKTSNSYSYH